MLPVSPTAPDAANVVPQLPSWRSVYDGNRTRSYEARCVDALIFCEIDKPHYFFLPLRAHQSKTVLPSLELGHTVKQSQIKDELMEQTAAIRSHQRTDACSEQGEIPPPYYLVSSACSSSRILNSLSSKFSRKPRRSRHGAATVTATADEPAMAGAGPAVYMVKRAALFALNGRESAARRGP
ncbi:hypothetical protein PR202_ga06504 [Eleusine coracana subsp. coracana]|uniref:Uncharacterized protein n=1 Tax=Eleusine coracana subsp. coracana TaxID=191504 RepID=A0AAV5BXC2_ELECO|nr:hypothetical protein PR202_ga06504 [Eleusine coracana subsp. coracana]